MNGTETAEKAAGTTREPLEAARIDHDALYGTLRRLAAAAGTTLRAVDKNAAELHKCIETLREAHAAAEDLFFPPPPPAAPEDAIVLFAHAVRPGDQLHLRGEWVTVSEVAPDWLGRDGARQVMCTFRTPFPRHHFDPMEPLPVRRPQTKAATEAEGGDA